MVSLLMILIFASVTGAVYFTWLGRASGKTASPLSLGLAGVAILLTLVRMMVFLPPQDHERALTHLVRFQDAQALAGAQLIAARHPGKSVVVLLPPKPFGYYSPAPGTDQIVEQLISELERAGLRVRTLEIQVPDFVVAGIEAGNQEENRDPSITGGGGIMQAMQNFMMYFDAAQFGRMTLDVRDADVVISAFDPPMTLDATALPGKSAGPALIMLFDNIQGIASGLESTLLDAVILRKNPNQPWDFNQSLPRKPKDAFEQWFLWVTPENARQVQHPSL